MFFADDIVLVPETIEEANTKLEEWRAVQESKGLRIRTKKEYMRCSFSGNEQGVCQDVTIGEDVVTSTTKFKYLRLIIQSNEEIDGDVTHHIQAGWRKWRAATGVAIGSSRLD